MEHTNISPNPRAPGAWLRALVHRTFLGHFEKSFARRASAELLRIYWHERKEHPELSGRDLYQRVVARRLGARHERARDIIRGACDSFTQWPAPRELRFRDVVRFLVFEEYTHSDSTHWWTKTDMGDVVARVIPEDI